MATVAVRTPGGITLVLRQLRIRWLRASPLLFGRMARRSLPNELVRGWTEPGLRTAEIRRDLRKYATSSFNGPELVARTEALRNFPGPALILWSSAGRVMPREHGRRLAELLPSGRLVEIDDAYVLSMLDRPEAVARAMTEFLTRTRAGKS